MANAPLSECGPDVGRHRRSSGDDSHESAPAAAACATIEQQDASLASLGAEIEEHAAASGTAFARNLERWSILLATQERAIRDCQERKITHADLVLLTSELNAAFCLECEAA